MKENIPLPIAFVERMRQRFPEAETIISALDGIADVSLRINPRKVKSSCILDPVPWCENGFYLPIRLLFAADPWWHAGAYYVQEAGSMLLEKAFRQCVEEIEHPKVLDLCAAPGGKSTHMLSMMDGKGVLVSNETIRSRIAPLRENLLRWGYSNMIITGSDPKDFSRLPELFDVVVVDAPCSGEGLFRREPHARSEWSPENADMCALRQKRILADVWPCLKGGGYMIYSTCTFNPSENDENIRWLMGQEDAEWVEINTEGVPKTEYGLQAAPGRTRSEGFFIAVVKKLESAAGTEKRMKKQKGTSSKTAEEVAQKHLPEHLQHLRNHQSIFLFSNAETWELLDRLEKIFIVQAGFPLGEEKGRDFQWSEFSPFSVDVAHERITEISLEDAWRFLRKETQLQASTPIGTGIFTFQGVPLGAYKNIGNRLNNNFPKEWRLRAEMNELREKQFLLSEYCTS